MAKKLRFAIIGVGGYVAPKHLKAIKDCGHEVVAALDKHDSVGILDRYFDNVHFFTEFERFDRHLEKLKREGKKVDYVSICSPNYLHDSHIMFALRVGANAICEKPLVVNPWNLEQVSNLEKESEGNVFNVLQLRCHPSIVELKEKVAKSNKKHEIKITYITPRGKWYFASWKGIMEKSGGVAVNIGIHLFDMLLWIFGDVKKNEVHMREDKKLSGYMELEKANVKWYLSVDKKDLFGKEKEGNMAYRCITVDNEPLEFSKIFFDLHTKVYEDILAGNGFGVKDAKPSIDLVHAIRHSELVKPGKEYHPILDKLKEKK